MRAEICKHLEETFGAPERAAGDTLTETENAAVLLNDVYTDGVSDSQQTRTDGGVTK